MFMMRFDMRAPDFGASTGDLYAAALEMASYAESRGVLAAVVCEHHTMADGYLPSPLVLATAMAARTSSLSIMTAALILPLYDPIRLAEDMVVLDIISGGRVSYVMAVGYRPEEFEHHGADFSRRGRLVEDQLALLLRAKSGEPFEHEGRRIHVTPAPVTPGGPTGDLGRRESGSGEACRAVRARLHRGRAAVRSSRRSTPPRREPTATNPGFCMIPPTDMATTVFVVRRSRRRVGGARPAPPARRAELRRAQRGQHPHRQPVHRHDAWMSCAPRTARTASSPPTKRSR